jgi:hypothetical protein
MLSRGTAILLFVVIGYLVIVGVTITVTVTVLRHPPDRAPPTAHDSAKAADPANTTPDSTNPTTPTDTTNATDSTDTTNATDSTNATNTTNTTDSTSTTNTTNATNATTNTTDTTSTTTSTNATNATDIISTTAYERALISYYLSIKQALYSTAGRPAWSEVVSTGKQYMGAAPEDAGPATDAGYDALYAAWFPASVAAGEMGLLASYKGENAPETRKALVLAGGQANSSVTDAAFMEWANARDALIVSESLDARKKAGSGRAQG